MEKIYDLEDRLVRLAGEVVNFSKSLSQDYEVQYYIKQLIRSSGSAALNYGEAQGTVTEADFINKTSIVVKELKETRTALKVLAYLDIGESAKREWLIRETQEIIAITSRMILNKKSKT